MPSKYWSDKIAATAGRKIRSHEHIHAQTTTTPPPTTELLDAHIQITDHQRRILDADERFSTFLRVHSWAHLTTDPTGIERVEAVVDQRLKLQTEARRALARAGDSSPVQLRPRFNPQAAIFRPEEQRGLDEGRAEQ